MFSFKGKINSKWPLRRCSSSNSAIISRSSSDKTEKPSRKEGIIILSFTILNFSGDIGSYSLDSFFIFLGDSVSCLLTLKVGDMSWFINVSDSYFALGLVLDSKPSNLCLFSFFLSSSMRLRSYSLNPTRCRVSQSSMVFTYLS